MKHKIKINIEYNDDLDITNTWSLKFQLDKLVDYVARRIYLRKNQFLCVDTKVEKYFSTGKGIMRVRFSRYCGSPEKGGGFMSSTLHRLELVIVDHNIDLDPEVPLSGRIYNEKDIKEITKIIVNSLIDRCHPEHYPNTLDVVRELLFERSGEFLRIGSTTW